MTKRIVREVYRGETMPKPYPSGGHWVINDGAYGYMTSHSEEAVKRYWRETVDHDMLRRVLNEGRYVRPFDGDALGCPICGACVYDYQQHDKWHGESTT